MFQLSELKDATNGFKEYFNEFGRGNTGFVYKVVLPDELFELPLE